MTGDATTLTKQCLENIDRLNPTLQAVITPMPEAALDAAARADAATERGDWLGVLHGMPVSVKDVFATAGVRSTLGSDFFRSHIPRRDAEVVRRLKAAGAVLVAKDNLHELATGSTTNNPHFGQCRNPWNLDRIPGGSSGGSAVAVAAGMTVGAIGTDAGGSIRGPASLTGVAGLRPTFGRVSNWNDDLPDLADFTVPGPLARRVTDLARLFVAIDGYDERDVLSRRGPREEVLARLGDGIDGLRVGVASDPFFSDVDVHVAAAVEAACGVLESLGAELTRVFLPGIGDVNRHFDAIRNAQGAAILARQLDEAPHRFGEDVLRRLMDGRRVSGVDYARAVAFRRQWVRTVERAFEQVDVIVTATTPVVAPPASTGAVSDGRFVGELLRPWPMADVPALSLPCGFSDDHLPIGLQLAGQQWSELRLLQVGVAFQQVTDWHQRTPPHGAAFEAAADSTPVR